MEIRALLRWMQPVDLDLFAFVETDEGEERMIGWSGVRDDGNVFLEVGRGIGDPDFRGNEEVVVCRRLDGIRRILFVAHEPMRKNRFSDCQGRLEVTTDSPGQEMLVINMTPCEIAEWCVIAMLDNIQKDCPRLYAINRVANSLPRAGDTLWQTFDER